MQKARDAEFGKKLDLLAGIIGHQLPSNAFDGVVLSRALRITPQELSKKRRGTLPVNSNELACLVTHLGLGGSCDFRLFHLPYDDFAEEIKRLKLGTYSGDILAVLREFLLAASQRRVAPLRPNIAIKTLSLPATRGGLGYVREAGRNISEFRVGSLVCAEIKVHQPGFLLVLNDDPRLGVTCLLPSVYAPMSRMAAGVVRIPSDAGGFQIEPPLGHYRLFALWVRDSFVAPWCREASEIRFIERSELSALHDDLQQRDGVVGAGGKDAWTAGFLDYVVSA